MPDIPLDTFLTMINQMIEEAQAAANAEFHINARMALLAQRDALTELKLRIRDGRFNANWLREYKEKNDRH